MFILLSLILCAVTALYLYVRECNNYWKKRGVVTVKTNFFFGSSFDSMSRGRRSVAQIHHDIYNAAPNEPYVGIYMALKPTLFIRDPELIHRMMVTDFSSFHDHGEEIATTGGRLVYNVMALRGEEWKTVRNELTSTFSDRKMRNMYHLIEGCAKILMEYHLKPVAGTGEPIEVREIMTRYALDVIGCCAFGLQFDTLKDSDTLFHVMVKLTSSLFGLGTLVKFIMRVSAPKLVRWLNIKPTTQEIEDFFFSLLHDAEEIRHKESAHREDLLQLMLDIRDEKDNEAIAVYLFTDEHIASNIFMFYVAGYETSASALSFALYELALNPEVQDKLRDEIRAVREAHGGVLDYNTMKKMVYLEMVISETLRLHSPNGTNGRVCTEAYQLPGSSYTIKPGVRIRYSITGLHMDEKYFPNPEKFDPERFSAENIAQRNPYVYLPFGSGPRICMGLRFAKLEMKISLVHILLRYKFSRCEKTEVPITLNPKGFTRAAKNGIWLATEEIRS